jgi:iron complex outermembrane recepter protein
MKKTVLSLTALCALFGPLEARDVTLEALTVTSSPLDDTELDAPDAVEIYTAEDIANAHVQSLYEFFNLQTSVAAVPSYGNPMAQRLDLHGYGIENGYQNIVITLNGRRLNNIDMVPQLLGAINPADVERLEIVKSGGVVLGGDGANAGVINIVTKNNSTKEVSFYGGIYTTYDAAFRAGHSDDLMTVSASGEAYRTAGTRHIDAAQDRDAQKLANGTFDLMLTPNRYVDLRLGVQSARTDATYGGTLTQAEYEANPAQSGSGSAADQQYDTDAYNAGITLYPTDKLSLSLDASLEKKKSDYAVPSWFYRSVADYDYRSAGASLDYADGGLRLTAGTELFDGKRDSGATAYAIASETTKKNTAGYALAQYRSGGHTFKAGYRYARVSYDYRDANSSLKRSDTLSGVEAGYNYQLSPERSVFLSYAHAYQAPDIDRFFSRDYVTGLVAFNGFIDPMTSDSFTLGYTALSASNKFKLSVYYVALKNEIYYNSYTWSNTNIDRSHKYGVDLYELWKVTDKMALSLNYNYVQAIIDDETEGGRDYGGNTLPGVSDHSLKAALSVMPTEALTFTLSHTYRSSAYALNDIGNDFAQRQQPYNSTDVALTYAKASYTLFAKINNMFNNANGLWVQDDAIYPYDFTTTAIAGATLKF